MLPKQIQSQLEKQAFKSEHLDLSNCGLGDKDMNDLYDLLERNPTITSLDLERNNIHSTGAKTVAQLPHIKKVNLRQNKIDDTGIQAFLENKKIEWLDLSINTLTDKSAGSLLEKLEHQNNLSYLNISENEKVKKDIIERVRSLCKKEYKRAEQIVLEPSMDLGNYTTLGNLQLNMDVLSDKKPNKESVKTHFLVTKILNRHNEEINQLSEQEKQEFILDLANKLNISINTSEQKNSFALELS